MSSSITISAEDYKRLKAYETVVQSSSTSSNSKTVRGIVARGYCRVSTELQRNGNSMDSQVDEITRLAQYRKWNVVKIYSDEAYTGTNDQRPGLQEMLSEAKRGEFIVVYSVSRLGRNAIEALNNAKKLYDKGVNIYTTKEGVDTTTHMGKLLFTILAGLAEMETESSNAVIMDTMNNMSAKGHLRGRPKFGTMFIDKNLPFAPHEGEQECLDVIREKLNGQDGAWWTDSRLSRFLNAQDAHGVPDPNMIEYYKKTKHNEPIKRADRLTAGKAEWMMFTPSIVRTILINYGLRTITPVEEGLNPAPGRRLPIVTVPELHGVRSNGGTLENSGLPVVGGNSREGGPYIATPVKGYRQVDPAVGIQTPGLAYYMPNFREAPETPKTPAQQ